MRIPAYVTIFVIALAIRLAAWAFVERQIAADTEREFLIAGDAEGYWDLGTDLAAGRKYSVYTPPRRVLRTPGVPVTIASSIAIFGESKTAARGMMAFLAAVGPVMIYGLGWRVGGRAVGMIAGLLAAVSPLAVGLSPVLLSDGLFAALLALQLSIAAPLLGVGPTEGENAARPLRYATLGAAAGAAVLVRPAWLPAVPIIAALLWWFGALSRRRTVANLLLFVATFALLMAPWVIRNARVTGHFVPTSLWLGPTLYDSFGPDADGGSNMAFFDNEASARVGMSEYEVDQWYRSRSWHAIVDDPGRAFRLAVAKQSRFWAWWPRADEIASQPIRVSVVLWTAFVSALALWQLRCGISWATFWLTAGPLFYFAALHLVFVGSMRYRMPAELPLCVLAALPIHAWLGQRAKNAPIEPPN